MTQNEFRGRGTMTPFVGTHNGACGSDLRFAVEATQSGSASMSANHGVRLSAVFGPETFVERVGDDVLALLAAAGDFASVNSDEPAVHGRIAAVRADGPKSATLVWLVAVANGRSVLRAANPGFPDIAEIRVNETMPLAWWCSSGGRSEAQRPVTTGLRERVGALAARAVRAVAASPLQLEGDPSSACAWPEGRERAAGPRARLTSSGFRRKSVHAAPGP